VEQSRHDARRIGGAIWSFAGKEAPSRFGLGAQTLR
jgi:hypothetical protein